MACAKRKQWNSSLCRKTPLRAKSAPGKGEFKQKPRKQLRAGKKTREWERVRAGLKTAFANAGVATCELMILPGCWKDSGLGFAHSKRRRNITGSEITEVILCCNHCHEWLDSGGEERCSRIVREIIARRDPLFEKLKKERK